MKAKVNDRFLYDLSAQSHLEIVEQKGAQYKIRYQGRTSTIEVLDYDIRQKSFEFAQDGHVFKVTLQDGLDDVLKMIRQQDSGSSRDEVIVAPIPGLIKNLIKTNGDSVKEGESVLILEAMKMENTIQAPYAVEQIEYHVSEGDHVSKGEKLLTLIH
ncbi:acetyl-CoA carboxylase biotin carboxyl carrier protein subunit [Membranicola marinus]|uniref:Acetyl-CoA carboxylase biotin carboxyl carrier protein subunit n=1 Tax=Membranihabitans marinus TaxID=1227546 RepID=A0A953HX79_9BACT|nr:acetyl-CoA carboxylase biotin carboxyl carrier protein subunit [Membranihabitans marinus]MBY5958276.1 acetyl-CoA carboxylase biotin carboxyl carrier protein subunit [Membranihabitans marinus]